MMTIFWQNKDPQKLHKYGVGVDEKHFCKLLTFGDLVTSTNVTFCS